MPLKTGTVNIIFRTTEEIRERLRHHALRTGEDMNSIVRSATIQRLEFLDEKERLYLETKKMRLSTKKTFEITPNKSTKETWEELIQKVYKPTDEKPVPEKIEKSFRRWCEYLEGAVDISDKGLRIDHIMKDLREKCKSESEVQRCFRQFEEFLAIRTEAKNPPKETVIDTLGNTIGAIFDE